MFCSFFINDQLMMVFFWLSVTIRFPGTCKFSFFPKSFFCAAALFGKVFRIELIDNILQWNCKIHTLSEGIEIICHSQKSYMEKREYSFNIIAGFDIISAKSGQIFYNNTVDFSMLDIFHHLYESRTVKICTWIVWVLINFCNRNIFRICYKVFHQFHLGFYRSSF